MFFHSAKQPTHQTQTHVFHYYLMYKSLQYCNSGAIKHCIEKKPIYDYNQAHVKTETPTPHNTRER